MKEKEKGKIQSVTIENFTCFENVHLDFSTGINLFIGENGTGKTHVLKALYAILRKNPSFGSVELTSEKNGNKAAEYGLATVLNFQEVFKDADCSRDSSGKYTIDIRFENNEVVNFEFNAIKNVFNGKFSPPDNPEFLPNLKPLFIPSTEMLSWFKGFVPAYEQRENGFDATFYDLGKALSLLPLRDNVIPNKKEMLELIEETTNILVTQVNGEFYVSVKEKDSKAFNSSRVASGINKLAQMIYLIRNGSLTKETILFWDEPEVNLNPKYIRLVADFLMALAKAGVQIFVATHDYLLAHYLSTKADYREVTDAPPMKFFAFTKREGGTEVEDADSLAGIQNNTLLDEYAGLYDMEGQLFSESLKNKYL